MRVSVIVPAYNSERTIAHCLTAINNSFYKNFELIVVDDGSTDQTQAIAKKYTGKVIAHPKKTNPLVARLSGARASEGDILIFIDSDVVVPPETLEKIVLYFSDHKEMNALTGLLSRSHPSKKFFSQYKNLYMNFIFRQLPDRVTFLYGSMFSLRRKLVKEINLDYEGTEDTALGQFFHHRGEQIGFFRDLEVVHLKEYDFFSWLKNDFRTPYLWTRLFMKYKGWRQFAGGKTGFAHSSKSQIASIGLVLITLSGFAASVLKGEFLYLSGLPLILWILLNKRFFSFLEREKGTLYSIKGVFITFLDHIVMGSGIMAGFTAHLLEISNL